MHFFGFLSDFTFIEPFSMGSNLLKAINQSNTTVCIDTSEICNPCEGQTNNQN